MVLEAEVLGEGVAARGHRGDPTHGPHSPGAQRFVDASLWAPPLSLWPPLCTCSGRLSPGPQGLTHEDTLAALRGHLLSASLA